MITVNDDININVPVPKTITAPNNPQITQVKAAAKSDKPTKPRRKRKKTFY